MKNLTVIFNQNGIITYKNFPEYFLNFFDICSKIDKDSLSSITSPISITGEFANSNVKWQIESISENQFLASGVLMSQQNFNVDIYQRMMDDIPIPIFWKDTNLTFIGCNKAFAQDAGVDNALQLLGKRDQELPWQAMAEKYAADDRYVLNSKQSLAFEEENTNHAGVTRTVLVIKSPITSSDGMENRASGLMGIYLDVSDKKKLEAMAIEKKELERKTYYMGFAGSIAHDLRTPLSTIGITMYGIERHLQPLIESYLIAKQQNLQITHIGQKSLDTLKTCINSCKKEVEFSHSYINLILSNLNCDNVNTDDYQELDAVPIIAAAIESYPFQNHEKNWVNFDAKVDFTFWGNETYLKNIINNLLKNSLYYINECHRGDIFISTQEDDKHYILLFKDTAKGASEEVMQHMFEGYYSKRRGGTGLGLSFCKNIMESFHGSISVSSIENQFIEFTLKFPKNFTQNRN